MALQVPKVQMVQRELLGRPDQSVRLVLELQVLLELLEPKVLMARQEQLGLLDLSELPALEQQVLKVQMVLLVQQALEQLERQVLLDLLVPLDLQD